MICSVSQSGYYQCQIYIEYLGFSKPLTYWINLSWIPTTDLKDYWTLELLTENMQDTYKNE